MTHEEIFRALIDGKKIRHKEWDKKHFVYLKYGKIANWLGMDERPTIVSYPENFEIYEEPKQKKKYWKWFVITPEGYIAEGNGLWDEGGISISHKNGVKLTEGYKLLKKFHEDIFVEVEE